MEREMNLVINLQDTYQKDPSIVSREIAGDVILVPIRRNMGDLESIYTLNKTAAVVWAQIDGSHTIGQIVDQIVLEFDVDPDQAKSDMFDLIKDLEQIDAIVRP